MIVLQNDSRIEVSKVTNGDSCGGKCESMTKSKPPHGVDLKAGLLYQPLFDRQTFVALA